jgi:DNA-binding transcriptional ArsR family regulator
LRRRRPSSTLLLLVFFISFLALTCAPYNHNLLLKIPRFQVEEAITYSSGLLFDAGSCDKASILLNQTTRMNIYDFIEDNPGIHFRAISDCLDMPIGVLQYHLGLLVNSGLVSDYRDGRYKRYFESKRFTETEMKIISALRHETSGKILSTLLRKPQTSHKDLANQLNISSQALSWQMRCFEKMGFIKKEVELVNVRYSLSETISVTVDRCSALLNLKTY